MDAGKLRDVKERGDSMEQEGVVTEARGMCGDVLSPQHILVKSSTSENLAGAASAECEGALES